MQIQNLIQKNAISKCKPVKGQFISNIFLTPKPDGSARMILNLKNLNNFIHVEKFKLEDIKVASRLLSSNCFMAKIDLSDAFHMVSVLEEDRKFLRFEFEGDLYEYNCLPFGICSAPYVFTKIIKPVLYYLRKFGYMSTVYIDDFLLFGDTYNECAKNVAFTLETLTSLGFIPNMEKSILKPSRTCVFLGLEFDSINMCIRLPKDKQKHIYDLICQYQKIIKCKIRDFAKFIGTLNFATTAVKYSPMYLKNLERIKIDALFENNNNFEAIMRLPHFEISDDLNWWKEKIKKSHNPIKRFDFQIEIASDASKTGWGAHSGLNKTHGFWDSSEKEKHINFLELKAAFFALLCFADSLYDCDILLRLDNKTAISYINRMGGTHVRELNHVAKEIWQFCEKRELWVYASYITSKDNKIADIESRTLEPETEFEISEFYFNIIIKKFGTFDIDLFASRVNNKCNKYISWKQDPFAFSVDAFTINWAEFYFYAFPPFSLILRSLKKIKREKAVGIMVVPYWPSQPWYPLFCKMLISKPLYLGPDVNLLFSSDRSPHPLWEKLSLVVGKLSG